MARIPIFIVSREAIWLSRRLSSLLAGASLPDVFSLVDKVPTRAPRCVVATDDLGCEELRRAILQLSKRRPSPPDTMVFSFDDPLRIRYLLGFPGLRLFTLPAELHLARRAISERFGATTGLDPDLLRRDLPGSLTLGLRTVLTRSNADGQPPPRSVAALAGTIGCRPETLHRQASHHGLVLKSVCAQAFLLWLQRGLISGRSADELARAAGYTGVRGLRRFVRASLGASVGELARLPPGTIEERMSASLDPVMQSGNRRARA